MTMFWTKHITTFAWFLQKAYLFATIPALIFVCLNNKYDERT